MLPAGSLRRKSLPLPLPPCGILAFLCNLEHMRAGGGWGVGADTRYGVTEAEVSPRGGLECFGAAGRSRQEKGSQAFFPARENTDAVLDLMVQACHPSYPNFESKSRISPKVS